MTSLGTDAHVAIVDVALDNVRSVANVLRRLGVEAEMLPEPPHSRPRAVVLPGAGSLNSGVVRLTASGWFEYLNTVGAPDFFGYAMEAAARELEKRFGQKRCLFRHSETFITRFHLGYSFPSVFGVDNHRVHESNLIMSGHNDRETALEWLNHSPYPNQRDADSRTGWGRTQLDDCVDRPTVTHDDNLSELVLQSRIASLLSFAHSHVPK